MRNKIMIIVTIIFLVLIIGTASAGEIKGVKKEQIGSDIILTVFTDNDVNTVNAGSNLPQIESSNGVKKWTSKLIESENAGQLEISTTDTSSNYDKLKILGTDDDSNSCINRYNSHAISYPLANVIINNFNLISTYHLDTETDSLHTNAGIIEVLICPTPYNNPTLDLLHDPTKWKIKSNIHWDYFSFVRQNGNDDNIQLGTDTDIGTATYTGSLPNQQYILLHIYDTLECGRTNEGETCWRRPGQTPRIPEFSTIAIPIAAVLGLVFFFQHRKKKEE